LAGRLALTSIGRKRKGGRFRLVRDRTALYALNGSDRTIRASSIEGASCRRDLPPASDGRDFEGAADRSEP
jgi:hypothetical protein